MTSPISEAPLEPQPIPLEGSVTAEPSPIKILAQEKLMRHQESVLCKSGHFQASPSFTSPTLNHKIEKQKQASIQKAKTKLEIKTEKTLEDLEAAPNEEAWEQILTQDYAYRNVKVGDIVPQPNALTVVRVPLKVIQILEDKEGFRALVLAPANPSKGNQKVPAPRLIFRGTIPRIENFFDDMNKEVGMRAFKRNQAEVYHLLSELKKTYGVKPEVSGHSLGGSLAQLTVAHFPSLISKCTYYNAPGINNRLVDHYLNQIKNKDTKPTIICIRHASDMISLAGGPHIPATYTYIKGTLNKHDFLVKAHSIITFANPSLPLKTEDKSQLTVTLSSLLEAGRSISYPIPVIYDELKKIQTVANQKLKELNSSSPLAALFKSRITPQT